ncbi:MAG: hypothetical protein ACREOE_11575 [Gemmatimonadales bacterium]
MQEQNVAIRQGAVHERNGGSEIDAIVVSDVASKAGSPENGERTSK